MTTTPTSPRSPVFETQEAQHSTIRGLVADLLAASDVDRTRGLVVHLDALLVEHFAHEEASDGVFAGILEQDPMLGADIDRFLDDHRRIVDDLARLHRALDQEPDTALDLAQALGRALAAHEQAENELMMQALYEDMGAHD